MQHSLQHDQHIIHYTSEGWNHQIFLIHFFQQSKRANIIAYKYRNNHQNINSKGMPSIFCASSEEFVSEPHLSLQAMPPFQSSCNNFYHTCTFCIFTQEIGNYGKAEAYIETYVYAKPPTWYRHPLPGQPQSFSECCPELCVVRVYTIPRDCIFPQGIIKVWIWWLWSPRKPSDFTLVFLKLLFNFLCSVDVQKFGFRVISFFY